MQRLLGFTKSVLGITILTALTACCWGGPIASVDASCDPTVNTPVAGGCTWYNYYAHTDGSITGGSSFANYYSAASDPAWTITTVGFTLFRVLDGGHQGDTFNAYDNLALLGTTSSTSIDATHACAGDSTGTHPDACWNDPLMSRGSFLLAPGPHSLTVTWVQRVPGGDSTLQWFELAATTNPVPEPGALALVGTGLLAAGGILRKKSKK